jgi:pimeloyl-ACP methyl ester carboxylesterase
MSTSSLDVRTREIEIATDEIRIRADLSLPAAPVGLILFAHGSGSSRFSGRNRAVAAELQRGRLGTLLLDLLSEEEERIDAGTGHLRFDIPLLAGRLLAATRWASRESETRTLPVGYFGASTGAGAALLAAANLPSLVRAVVSRGGRPDLAGPALAVVRAPTLLIVGGFDAPVVEINREALAALRCTKRLEIVPGATHLFEEPDALGHVARLAREWFERYVPVRVSS